MGLQQVNVSRLIRGLRARALVAAAPPPPTGAAIPCLSPRRDGRPFRTGAGRISPPLPDAGGAGEAEFTRLMEEITQANRRLGAAAVKGWGAVSFYGLMQLGVPQLKGLLRQAAGAERRRLLLALLARDAACVGFAVVFISALTALFGGANSPAAVVIFCLLLSCRFVHYNYRMADTLRNMAAAFALLTLGPALAPLGGPCSTCFSTCSVSECCCSSPPTSPSWATPPSTCSAIFSCMEIRSAGARSPCGAGDAAGLRPVRRGALP